MGRIGMGLKSAAKWAGLVAALALTAVPAFAEGERGPNVPNFWVRDGYRVTLAADNLAEARFIEFDDKGTLYVSQPKPGKIVALRDTDGDGTYETRTDFISDKPGAHGMHFYDGWLWFTQSGSIHKARDTDGDGKADEVVTVVGSGLAEGGGHWWRAICVDKTGIYTSIGDDGNINEHNNDERCRIWKFDLDGSSKSLFASGLRNTEKLRMRPGTTQLYGCDHGSDNYGKPFGERGGKQQPVTDLNPPCEFNLYVQGGFYGHPYIVGDKLPRLEFKDRRDILDLADRTIPPAWSLGGHVAPNGWNFVTKDAITGRAGDALVALHGSWNSTKRVGYSIEHVMFDEQTGRPYGARPIVVTLGEDGRNIMARPCDVAEAADGSVYFTCDMTRKIYRITKSGR